MFLLPTCIRHSILLMKEQSLLTSFLPFHSRAASRTPATELRSPLPSWTPPSARRPPASPPWSSPSTASSPAPPTRTPSSSPWTDRSLVRQSNFVRACDFSKIRYRFLLVCTPLSQVLFVDLRFYCGLLLFFDEEKNLWQWFGKQFRAEQPVFHPVLKVFPPPSPRFPGEFSELSRQTLWNFFFFLPAWWSQFRIISAPIPATNPAPMNEKESGESQHSRLHVCAKTMLVGTWTIRDQSWNCAAKWNILVTLGRAQS